MAGDIVVNKIQALSVNEDTLDDLTIHGMVINDANTVLLTDLNSALPANVAIDTRYVLVNPFGINTPVEAIAEVFANSVWSAISGHIYPSSSSNASGIGAYYVEGVGVVLQTGKNSLMYTPIAGEASVYSGSGHGAGLPTTISAPCRVRVTRIGGN